MRMAYEEIYKERYARSEGKENIYVRFLNKTSAIHLKSHFVRLPILERIKVFVQEVFLPQGYPESVSEDYWQYQLWDSLQAFCSTLSGTLATQAILKGVGVGDANSTPLSAAITWILKDGTGMIGRILFAWQKGTSLDSECKKWRLFADVLNDAAMCIEMFVLPLTPLISTEILCVSTTMKGIVGVAGGATRASVTQHQAIKNNMGDVSAKDGSQETCLNLIGSLFGILVLTLVAENDLLAKLIFMICIVAHVYANYRAVKALNFKTLNKERLMILLKTYLKYNMIESSRAVNLKESVFLGQSITDNDLCGFNIDVGCSLKEIIEKNLISNAELMLYSSYNDIHMRSYMLVVSNELKTIFVPLKTNHTDQEVLLAYFNAVILGITICVEDNPSILDIVRPGGDRFGGTTILHQIVDQVKSGRRDRNRFDISTLMTAGYFREHINNGFLNEIFTADECVLRHFDFFIGALKANGWVTERHHLPVGKWRAVWGADLHSKTN